MIKFEDIINVIKKDEMLSKNLSSLTKDKSLNEMGFDSLDVMMIAHEVSEEFNIQIDITKNNSFDDIVKKLNHK